MKGTIHRCLNEVIVEHFGEETWKRALLKAGFPPDYDFSYSEDIDEEKSLSLIHQVVSETGKTQEEVFDLFGVHWACEYAPSHYAFWYMGVKSAKEFILKLDHVHDVVGKHFNNAAPPRFLYKELGENTLEIEYKSKRNLLPLFISLVKGLGVHFNEEIRVERLTEKKLRLHFV